MQYRYDFIRCDLFMAFRHRGLNIFLIFDCHWSSIMLPRWRRRTSKKLSRAQFLSQHPCPDLLRIKPIRFILTWPRCLNVLSQKLMKMSQIPWGILVIPSKFKTETSKKQSKMYMQCLAILSNFKASTSEKLSNKMLTAFCTAVTLVHERWDLLEHDINGPLPLQQ